MYLMMDHNETEYLKCLRCVHKLRLHWICCHWRHVVIEQLHDLEGISDEPNVENRMTQCESASTVNDHRIEMRGAHISIQTMTNAHEQHEEITKHNHKIYTRRLYAPD